MPDTGITIDPWPNSFEELFWNGLKRITGDVAICTDGVILNLGAGNTPVDTTPIHHATGPPVIELDKPQWYAPVLMEIEDGVVGTIHAYHFFEHLTDEELRIMLEECERVLKPRGVLNICVPYARADLAFQDIDHKLFFTEETWKTLLNNDWYDTGLKRKLNLHIGCNVIAGVKGANLAVFTQMMKGV
jgi:SAM-dependent methyltransferase